MYKVTSSLAWNFLPISYDAVVLTHCTNERHLIEFAVISPGLGAFEEPNADAEIIVSQCLPYRLLVRYRSGD